MTNPAPAELTRNDYIQLLKEGIDEHIESTYPEIYADLLSHHDAIAASRDEYKRKYENLLNLPDALPVEQVAKTFLEHGQIYYGTNYDLGAHARLEELLRRARIDGANSSGKQVADLEKERDALKDQVDTLDQVLADHREVWKKKIDTLEKERDALKVEVIQLEEQAKQRVEDVYYPIIQQGKIQCVVNGKTLDIADVCLTGHVAALTQQLAAREETFKINLQVRDDRVKELEGALKIGLGCASTVSCCAAIEQWHALVHDGLEEDFAPWFMQQVLENERLKHAAQ